MSLDILYSTLSGIAIGLFWEVPQTGIQIRLLKGGFGTSLRGVLMDFI